MNVCPSCKSKKVVPIPYEGLTWYREEKRGLIKTLGILEPAIIECIDCKTRDYSPLMIAMNENKSIEKIPKGIEEITWEDYLEYTNKE